MNKGIGLALLAVGLVLLYFGYNESQSVGSQLSEAFSGSPSDRSMMFYIGGVAAAAIGGWQLVKG